MGFYGIREALAAIRRAPLLTGLSASMVGLSLFVVGLFSLAAYNLRLALETIEERVEVVAFIADGTSTEEMAAGRAQLEALPEVERVRFVDKEEALRVAREELPEIGGLTADLEVNPFPASFEIKLVEDLQGPATVEEVSQAASLLPFVEDVRYGREWVEKLYTLRRMGAVASAVLGGAFAAVAALIIGSAIRIAIFARREEIEIMRLVGATHWFIRRPFLLEGALTGLVGAAMATVLTALAFGAVDGFLFEIQWLPVEGLILGTLIGVLFGVVSSGMAIRRHLKRV